MHISTLSFAGFILILYYMLPHRAQNLLLLIASYAFYAFWSWQFPLVLLGVTGFNFLFARWLQTHQKTGRTWLWLAIGINLLCLVFSKYANFFLPDITSMLARVEMNIRTDGLKILLPVGLSFYVLQAISYQVDVFRGQIRAATDIVDFALYMAYFPKLTAGPIERAREFLPKLARQRIVDNETLATGFTLIVIGLVRKVVMADTVLNAIPPDVFETPLDFSAPELVAWLMAYTFGLYNDFAGYTDIVRGVSGLFGIELSRNFAQPFFSRNFTDLWNRWHITMSHWLRDYIYFPISRALVRRNPSRYNPFNLILPPMLTMLASGIWHGPGWNVLVWGGVTGLYLVLERLVMLRWPPVPTDTHSIWRRRLSMMTVFTLVFASLIFFRMDLPVAKAYLQGLFNWDYLKLPNSRVFLLFIPSLWLDWVQYRNNNETIFLTWPPSIQSFLLALAALTVFHASRAGIGEPFIYQGF